MPGFDRSGGSSQGNDGGGADPSDKNKPCGDGTNGTVECVDVIGKKPPDPQPLPKPRPEPIVQFEPLQLSNPSDGGGGDKDNRPMCPSGPKVDRAKLLVRKGTDANLIGGGLLVGSVIANGFGGGPEDPLADAATVGLARWGQRVMAAGDLSLGIGAGYLASNGMSGEAVNTAIEEVLDRPIPGFAKPSVDQIIDKALNNVEDSLGVQMNSCRMGN